MYTHDLSRVYMEPTSLVSEDEQVSYYRPMLRVNITSNISPTISLVLSGSTAVPEVVTVVEAFHWFPVLYLHVQRTDV